MPSILQSRKHKADLKRQQDTTQRTAISQVVTQTPGEVHCGEARLLPSTMLPSNDDVGGRSGEDITEPFPEFEDTTAPDIYQSRNALRLAAHTNVDAGAESMIYAFDPSHHFMTRERHRQVSDEMSTGLAGLCIGMGVSTTGSNGTGKHISKKGILHGLGKRIWKNTKAKRETDAEVEEQVTETPSEGGEDSIEEPEGDGGLPLTTVAEGPIDQQLLEIIQEDNESGQESLRHEDAGSPAQDDAQDDASNKTAKPLRSGVNQDMPPVKPALEIVANDPLLWSSAMPFEKTAVFSLPHQWPVIKITNVPFTITKQEINQFLGRRSRPLLTDSGPAIHIIIERSTGKTLDCFVEFADLNDAKETLSWINRSLENGQPVKLGTRHIHAEMSSQSEMMKEMFPRAKCVNWEEGVPRVMRKKEGERWSTGFAGFVTEEEMFLTIRHAESPSRSPFVSRCPQRPFDFMISTLCKYPWYATTLYRVKDRNIIFTVTHRLLSILARRLHEISYAPNRNGHQHNGRGGSKPAEHGLDRRLAIDLLAAGLQCPGFNDRQKYCLHLAATNFSIVTATPLSARFWPFDTLARKGHAQEPLMLKYAGLIRRSVECQPVSDTSLVINAFDPLLHAASPFGCIYLEFNADMIFQEALDLELAMAREVIAEGVKILREEEATKARVPLEAFEKPVINTSAPSNMHIPSVKEVIYQLLPAQWRIHHYGFDPDSALRHGNSSSSQSHASETRAESPAEARAAAAAAEPKYANRSAENAVSNSHTLIEQRHVDGTTTTTTISYPSALEHSAPQALDGECSGYGYPTYDEGPAELGNPRNRWSADLRRVDWKSADRRRSVGMKSRPVSMPEPIAEDSMSLA